MLLHYYVRSGVTVDLLQATIVCVAAIAVHWRVYRQEALELGFRTSDVRTDGATGGSLEMEEGREVRHTVNSPAGDQEQRGASDA